MPINLSKGQKVDLTKGNPGLTKIMVGLGWDVNAFDSGSAFDLDAAAFLLGASGKWRGQKNGHSCQLVRLSRTAHGDPLAQIFAPRRMLPGHLRQIGQDMTGADRVAADAVLCKLDCHGTGQRDHAALRCAVD